MTGAILILFSPFGASVDVVLLDPPYRRDLLRLVHEEPETPPRLVTDE